MTATVVMGVLLLCFGLPTSLGCSSDSDCTGDLRCVDNFGVCGPVCKSTPDCSTEPGGTPICFSEYVDQAAICVYECGSCNAGYECASAGDGFSVCKENLPASNIFNGLRKINKFVSTMEES